MLPNINQVLPDHLKIIDNLESWILLESEAISGSQWTNGNCTLFPRTWALFAVY